MPDLYDSGTLHVTLTPFPDSIALTIEEALRVLYDFKHGNITQQELDEAKVPYLGTVHLSPKRATLLITRNLRSSSSHNAPQHHRMADHSDEGTDVLDEPDGVHAAARGHLPARHDEPELRRRHLRGLRRCGTLGYGRASLIGNKHAHARTHCRTRTNLGSTDIRAIVNEFFQGMRVMCASIGTSGTEPPASMEEQRQRVQNAVSSFPVPPVTPPAPAPAADTPAP